ncbi:MAG: K(+)-transporting ATPase subunit F [Patulibacter minatonensis]
MPTVLLSLSGENAAGLVVALLLVGYLIFALVRAERF